MRINRDRISDHEEIFIANARLMKDNADEDDNYQVRCVLGEKVYFSKDTKGRFPRHIYSSEGVAEFKISGMCEYHFDEATLPEDDDETSSN